MSELKRTQLYDVHVAAGATMVDFGGWEMPIKYPTDIVAEHLYTRHFCSLFDVSHMGRILVEGREAVPFLQHVLSSNVLSLDLNQAQYAIIPTQSGGAVDDAYLYRFEADRYLLVVNAANTDKDLAHLQEQIKAFDAKMTVITGEVAAIAVQGPKAKELLMALSGGEQVTEPVKNALNTLSFEGHTVRVAKTGYTGEPIGYEVYIDSAQRRVALEPPGGAGGKARGPGRPGHPAPGGGPAPLRPRAGRRPGGEGDPGLRRAGGQVRRELLGAEGGLHRPGGPGRAVRGLQAHHGPGLLRLSGLPRRIRPIALVGRGVMRAGMGGLPGRGADRLGDQRHHGPLLHHEGEGLETVILDKSAMRAIGLAYIASDVLDEDRVEVDVRGRRVAAVIPPYHLRSDAPPFARPILYAPEEEETPAPEGDRLPAALDLLQKAAENHAWRQERCVNLIPSEMTPSRAVRLLSMSDPSFRYAEHKKVKSFYDADVFYYQGTKFIDQVEQLLVEEMKAFLGCSEVETRVISGQMSNMAVFSALMDFKNRLDRKHDMQRLGYVLNNHIIKGGHLSAQPMGALHDYIAIDPVTERHAMVNFPVCRDNIYKIDVEETKKVIDQYRPELIIFGKSMVLHKEPVAAIRQFVDAEKIPTTIMYDMAHVLGLVGDYFQKPFEEGAEIVTGSTHKTFFGPQRGVIGVNYQKEDLKYGLWETIESRAFPGSVSNHHLGTQLGLLMAAYEMNQYKDAYQKAVVENAKSFARSLKAAGLEVAGDRAIGYTETHQVIVSVGYGTGPEVAERLERNNIIVNYQATPDEEGFTASGALRMGVSEMTRFGFDAAAFERTGWPHGRLHPPRQGSGRGGGKAPQPLPGDALLLYRQRGGGRPGGPGARRPACKADPHSKETDCYHI